MMQHVNETETITHFVFVDLENVPTVEIGLVAGRTVHVTLLIGKNQKQIDVAVALKAHRMADRVKLVEVGVTGRNALDLILGYHIGRMVEQFPDGQFFIVSKDKDFDSLISHLNTNRVKVSRHDSFAVLPFLPQPKRSAPKKDTTDRFDKLVRRLKDKSFPRPKKKSGLLARIRSDFGNKLDEAGAAKKLAALVKLKVVTIDEGDRVNYPE